MRDRHTSGILPPTRREPRVEPTADNTLGGVLGMGVGHHIHVLHASSPRVNRSGPAWAVRDLRQTTVFAASWPIAVVGLRCRDRPGARPSSKMSNGFGASRMGGRLDRLASVMRVRLLVLAGIVATSVAGCGGAGSDSAGTTATAPPIRTACDASAANGSVFTAEVRPDVPFALQVPQLRDWQVVPVEGEDLVLRRADRRVGRMGSASVTLGVSTPRRATDNVTVLSSIAGDWRQWRSEAVQVCGGGGTRSTGILPASGAEGVDHYHEFLRFDYLAGEFLYPVRMSVEATAADRDLYQPDIDSFVDGLQIVPISPAG
ncbi:hypothetical protein [Nocardia wallacei]|nr:hypothetical protein [Nocardia wallacei]